MFNFSSVCKIITLATLLLYGQNAHAQSLSEDRTGQSPVVQASMISPDSLKLDPSPSRSRTNINGETEESTEAESALWDAYMQNFHTKLRKVWSPPRGYEDRAPVIFFKIRNNGTITDLQLVRSCGLPKVDESLIEGIQKASPFNPLPPGQKDGAEIQFSYCTPRIPAGTCAACPTRNSPYNHISRTEITGPTHTRQ